jgi:hypothetical protein
MYPLSNLFDQQLLDELAEVQLIDFTQDTQGRVHVWVELGSDVFAFECHGSGGRLLWAALNTKNFPGNIRTDALTWDRFSSSYGFPLDSRAILSRNPAPGAPVGNCALAFADGGSKR